MVTSTSYEWRAFGEVSARVKERVRALPAKFDTPAKFTDDYIFRRGSPVNAKLRNGRLKFKELEYQDPDGFETWAVVDGLCVDADGIAKLEAALEACAPAEVAGCNSAEDLKLALPRFEPPLSHVEVAKSRRQYFQVVGGREVSIELAEIQVPETIESICIELETARTARFDPALLDVLRTVRDQLELPGGMQVKSYLSILSEWAPR